MTKKYQFRLAAPKLCCRSPYFCRNIEKTRYEKAIPTPFTLSFIATGTRS